MSDCFTQAMRALVVGSLLLATATLMLVVANTARAGGALAVSPLSAAYSFGVVDQARRIAPADI